MKPILFNTEMVKAILDDRKTTTRRIIKGMALDWLTKDGFTPKVVADPDNYLAPYTVGDILYVRETFYQYGEWYDTMKRVQIKGEWETVAKHTFVAKQGFPVYFKNTLPGNIKAKHAYKDGLGYYKRPSIFMPKEAAHIFLCVTSIKAERLQDITNAGALAEGCDGRGLGPSSGCDGSLSVAPYDFSVEKFGTVWDSTVKKSDVDRYGWGANPWVWVYEFERCEKPKEGLI